VNDQDILKFCTDDPAAADTTIKALQSVVDFHNGRGRLLAALSTADQPKAAKKPKLFLVK
jgi:hypothetical protein